MEDGSIEKLNDQVVSKISNESIEVQKIQNEQIKLLESKMRVERQLFNGASWFYWIAGLSILNTIVYVMGFNLNFVLGLGVTQVIDAFAYYGSGTIKLIAFILDIIVAGIFVLFGVYAKKRHVWAFITGMIIYTADALIFVFVKDWIAVGFHVFALYWVYKGLQANNILKKINQ